MGRTTSAYGLRNGRPADAAISYAGRMLFFFYAIPMPQVFVEGGKVGDLLY
jgi:hypothetical protein